MARQEDEDNWTGLLIGPLLAVCALVVLWKNETRYNYYREAKRTTEVAVLEPAPENQLISFTGPMRQEIIIAGDYLSSFQGYLVVRRTAEIYAWEHKKSDQGRTWKLTWSTSLEKNSRNQGIKKQLSSISFDHYKYHLGSVFDGLAVASADIQFVDPAEPVDIGPIEILDRGRSFGLSRRGSELYLSKQKDNELGDERVRYTGIPIPATATYFGKFHDGQGRAFDQHKRAGIIEGLIQDHGILHHLVAGDRDEALSKIKQHLSWVKMMLRAGGTPVSYTHLTLPTILLV